MINMEDIVNIQKQIPLIYSSSIPKEHNHPILNQSKLKAHRHPSQLHEQNTAHNVSTHLITTISTEFSDSSLKSSLLVVFS
jgi:hypothetical protein